MRSQLFARYARPGRTLVRALALGCCMTAAATADTRDADLLARAERAGDDVVQVATTVLGAAESQSRFGVPLTDRGVQLVWVQVENAGDQDLLLNLLAVDPHYFSPAEVAALSRRYRDEPAAHARRALFARERFPLIVHAGEKISGFVYTNLDPGRKAYTVQLVGGRDAHTFEFVVAVPEFEADFDRVDFERIYQPGTVTDLDLDGLRAFLDELPCCALGGDQRTPGDPLNLVVVGGGAHVLATFARRGWDLTETVRAASSLRTAMSSVFGRRYRTSPISGLYLFDRPQDVGLQKARETVDERNHLRLWLAPVTYRGQRVWVGQVSRDVGVKLSSKTIVTHRIDPIVDEARTYVMLDLLNSRYVAMAGYAGGVGVSRRDAPRQNYTLDPYLTDGLRAVIFLDEQSRGFDEVDWLDWEHPPVAARGFVTTE